MGNMCFSCLTVPEEKDSDYHSHRGEHGNNLLADVNRDTTGNLKDLTNAASRGDDVTLRDLIKKGVAVNNTDSHSQTAIFYASFGGFYKCVNLLIKVGAGVNVVNYQGVTPMMAAGDPGNVKCVQLLLKAGARVNMRDKNNLNALERYIKMRGGRNQTFLRVLFAAGEDDSTFLSEQNSYLGLPDYVDNGFSNHNLKHSCRLVIRKHLLSLDTTNLFVKVPMLGLPAFLSEYLLYDVELDFDTVDSMLNEVILKHQNIFQKWNVNTSEIRPNNFCKVKH